MSKNSGGGGDTTTTILPAPFQQPFIEEGLNRARALINNPPEVYEGPGIAPLSQDTIASFGGARQLAQDLYGFSDDLLGGFRDALNIDPTQSAAYQASEERLRSNVVDTLNMDILPGIDTQAAALGAFGGTDYLRLGDSARAGALEAVSTGTADLLSNFYSIDSAGRNAALGASGTVASAATSPIELLATSGGAQDARAQAELNDAIGTFNRIEMAPEQALDRFIGRVYGDFGSTSNTSGGGAGSNPFASAVGGGLAGASLGSTLFPAAAAAGPWGALIGGLGGLLFG